MSFTALLESSEEPSGYSQRYTTYDQVANVIPQAECVKSALTFHDSRLKVNANANHQATTVKRANTSEIEMGYSF